MKEIRLKFGESVSDDVVREVQKRASQYFGGSTVIEGRGTWYDGHELVFENSRTLVTTVLDSYDGAVTPEGFAYEHAIYIRDNSNEDAVYWDVREIDSGGIV